MDTSKKFKLPSPCFKEIVKSYKSNPCLAVPQGDLLPSTPPMYGPRGSTIPPRFLGNKYLPKYSVPFRKERDTRPFRNFENHQSKERFQNQRRPTKNGFIQNCQDNVKEQFWCDTCDRSFNSSAQLESHKFEHQICGIDDCMFIGHPTVVAKHIEAQHTSGLYKKIKNVSTPEEIAKWREERKKRYPTRTNVELRQKAQAERIKRGEKLTEKKTKFGQQSDRRQMSKTTTNEDYRKHNDDRKLTVNAENSNHNIQQDKKTNKRRKRPAREKKVENIEINYEKVKNDNFFNGKLKMFTGTLAIYDYRRPEKVNMLENNALSNLCDMYGSSSESDINDNEDLNENEAKSSKNNALIPVAKEDIIIDIKLENVQKLLNENALYIDNVLKNDTKNNLDNTERNSDNDLPDEKPIERIIEKDILSTNLQSFKKELPNVNEPPPNKRIRSNKYQNYRKNSKILLDYSKLKKRSQNTMLEKLLESDILHERNVLLQCVRYVVQNNYFGIGQKKY